MYKNNEKIPRISRQYIIGDVHGCVSELEELLSLVKFEKGVDDLYFVGDFLDRGPDSVGALRLARSLGAKSTMGNHELKYLRLKRGKGSKRKIDNSIYNNLSSEDWEYIEAMPAFYWLDDWIIAHAGFTDTCVFYKQPLDTICRVRWLKPDGNHSGRALKQEGDIHWVERWKGPQNVVYGHAVHDLEYIHWNKKLVGTGNGDVTSCYGIDTGCCFGGHLTCLEILPNKDHKIYQVKAKKEYSKWWGVNTFPPE